MSRAGYARTLARHVRRARRRAITALLRTSATRRLLFGALSVPIDPFDQAFRADPYPAFRHLREHAPVYRAPFGFWVVSGYADAIQVLNDSRFLNYDYRSAAERDGPMSAGQRFQTNAVVFLNPPDHPRIRGRLTGVFTPLRMKSLRSSIEAHTHRLIDRTSHLQQFDFAQEFAARLPVAVIADVLGLSQQHAEQCYDWGRTTTGVFSVAATRAEQERGEDGLACLLDYFRSTLRDRRDRPRSDLLSELAAMTGAEDGLTEEECVANATLLFVAGYETTVAFLGTAILTLLRHRDTWDALCADPGLARTAVDELLRLESPFQFFGREAREDAVVGGARIDRGQTVFVLVGAANRDPAQFPDPDRVDLSRRSPSHLAFGHGAHACIGQALARLEGEVTLQVLTERCSDLRLGEQLPVWRDDFQIRSLDSLVVRR